MRASLQTYCAGLPEEFAQIPSGRKVLLERLASFISLELKDHASCSLMFICTHNSRRSHFGQVWASVALHSYGIHRVQCFSAGTEVTAFNPNAVGALKRAGFTVSTLENTANPRYSVHYDDKLPPIICFSKTWDDHANPKSGFIAVMTCSDAEQNCPHIAGATQRIGITYRDPKAFDGTAQQDQKYDERCRQIAREMFYMASKI